MADMPEKYYRAFPAPKGKCVCGVLKPELTSVEKTRKVNGHEVVKYYPVVNEPPIYWRSDEKVLCFSKTPGGAVIGSVTGERGFKGGNRCVCVTEEQPDIDISHEMTGDFPVLEEVRFKRPVKTEVVGEFEVTDKLLKQIEHAYNTPIKTPIWENGEIVGWEENEEETTIDLDKLERIKNRINRQVLGESKTVATATRKMTVSLG